MISYGLDSILNTGVVVIGIVVFFVLWRRDAKSSSEKQNDQNNSLLEGLDNLAKSISGQHEEQTKAIVVPLAQCAHDIHKLVEKQQEDNLKAAVAAAVKAEREK